MNADTPMFNLIEEPWIPCVHPDGRAEEVGLREALIRSHEFLGISGETPLVTAALYRFLLAILHRVVDGPRTMEAWARLWEQGQWHPEQVDPYLEQWYDRFFLFHPDHPFFQWRVAKSRAKNIAALVPHVATGNNPTLFSHHMEHVEMVFPAPQAARWLLFVQTASISGGSGMAPKDATDAPWGKGIVFLLEGDTLFETLVLNLLPYPNNDFIPTTHADRPVWEAEHPLAPKRAVPLGYLDYLTWPTRSLCFVPEMEDGRLMVCQVHMGSGLRLDAKIRDPFHHYRVDRTRGFRVMRFEEGRSLWRDSATLLEFGSPEKEHPPAVFAWAADLAGDGYLPLERTYHFMALGMARNQARIDFYREEHLPLPGAYLQDLRLVEQLRQGLEMAHQVREQVMRATSRLATLVLFPTVEDHQGRRSLSREAKENVRNLMAHWAVERHYWASLDVPFLRFLELLPHNTTQAWQEWEDTLLNTARAAFNRAEVMAGTNVHALRAAVRARGQLEGGLKKLGLTQNHRKEDDR